MAWGAGLATIAADGSTLDTWYRWLGWGEFGSDARADGSGGDSVHWGQIEERLGMRDVRDEVRNVTIRPVRISVDVDEAPGSPEDAYLRLHLLSHRLATPRSITMDGTFGALNNVAWTNLGPVAVSEDEARILWQELHRKVRRHGEEHPVGVQPVVLPLPVGAEILDRGLHLDDPEEAVAAERGEVGAPARGQRQFRHHGEVQGGEEARRAAGNGEGALGLAAIDGRQDGAEKRGSHRRIMPLLRPE